jgi:hypothetical protein
MRTWWRIFAGQTEGRVTPARLRRSSAAPRRSMQVQAETQLLQNSRPARLMRKVEQCPDPSPETPLILRHVMSLIRDEARPVLAYPVTK